MVRSRIAALLFRSAGFLLILSGLLSMLGILSGNLRPSTLMFYTGQSNLLALILFGLLIFFTVKDLAAKGPSGSAGYLARFEMICSVNLLLTLAVYWIMLAPGISGLEDGSYSFWNFENLAVHLITPLLCITDYILFTPSGHLKYRDVYLVTVFPFIYMAFSSIAGLAGYVYWNGSDGLPVRFPYFFYDFDRIGTKSIVYIGILVIFFLALSHGLYLFDKKIKKPVIYPGNIKKSGSHP